MAASPIQVLVYRPNSDRGELVPIAGDHLEAMQGLVGGFIEEIRLNKLVATADPALLVIANEDGRESRLPANRLGLLGVFVVVRVDGDGEGYCSLTAADEWRVRDLLDAPSDASLN